MCLRKEKNNQNDLAIEYNESERKHIESLKEPTKTTKKTYSIQKSN